MINSTLAFIISFVSLWSSYGGSNKQPVDTNSGPNILFVFIDDLGFGDLGCYGNAGVRTSNIDKLSKEGIRFTQFYVNAPMCSPSRVAVLTGQYPIRWKITSALGDSMRNTIGGSAPFLDPKAPSIARNFQRNGYHTAHVGKWHMGGQRNVEGAPLISEFGFNATLTSFEGLGDRLGLVFEEKQWNGSNRFHHSVLQATLGQGEIKWVKRHKEPEIFVTRTLEEIKQAQRNNQPFFINLWPDAVHTPLEAPPALRGDGSIKAQYVGVITDLDEQLGKLFDFIRNDPKLRRNTLIIVASDNGPSHEIGSSGGLRSHKGSLYEGGIRVPFIIWGPGIIKEKNAGTVNRTTVLAGMDLTPSLLTIAGIKAPTDVKFDGIDMSKALLGDDLKRDQPVMWIRPTDPKGPVGAEWKNLTVRKDLAIRQGKWKLLIETDGSEPELYDLESNPGETINLAKTHPEVTAELKKKVLDWFDDMVGSSSTYAEYWAGF